MNAIIIDGTTIFLCSMFALYVTLYTALRLGIGRVYSPKRAALVINVFLIIVMPAMMFNALYAIEDSPITMVDVYGMMLPFLTIFGLIMFMIDLGAQKEQAKTLKPTIK